MSFLGSIPLIGPILEPPKPPDIEGAAAADRMANQQSAAAADAASRPNTDSPYFHERSFEHTTYDRHGNPQTQWLTRKIPTELGEELIAQQRTANNVRQSMVGAALRSVGLNPAGVAVNPRPVDPNLHTLSGGEAFLTPEGKRRARSSPHGNPGYVFPNDPAVPAQREARGLPSLEEEQAAREEAAQREGFTEAVLDQGGQAEQQAYMGKDAWNFMFDGTVPEWAGEDGTGAPPPPNVPKSAVRDYSEIQPAEEAPKPKEEEDVTGYYPWEQGMHLVGSRVPAEGGQKMPSQPYLSSALRRK